MAKIQIIDLPIHVYTCISDPSRMCISRIGDLPIFFTGETPLRAKRVADDWRREELEKIEDQKKRVADRAAERAAKRAGAA